MANWIFQSTAAKYDLPKALDEAARDNKVINFLVTQWADDILPADRVFVCFGGKEAPGLYATATVVTAPALRPMETWEQAHAKAEFPSDALRAQLKLDELLDIPISRADIYAIKALESHQFVKAHAGTNFKLTAEQARAINELIATARAGRRVRA